MFDHPAALELVERPVDGLTRADLHAGIAVVAQMRAWLRRRRPQPQPAAAPVELEQPVLV